MKVAICFSGQIRSFDLVKDSLRENLLSQYDCDIFCHFWNRYDGIKYENFYNPECESKYGYYGKYKIEDIVDFLKPTSLCFEYPSIQQNMKSMFYSIKRCNELKKSYEYINDFKYDVVIKARYDLFYNKKIELQNINHNELYTSSRYGPGGVTEWFMYSSSPTMDIVTSIYENIEYAKDKSIPCPELILESYLNTNNINTNKIHFGVNILREDGKALNE